MKPLHLTTRPSKEKILLVVIDYKFERSVWSVDQVKEEMKELVEACGGEVIDSIVCHLEKPTASYLISTGKLQEIQSFCLANPVDTVIFSRDLKGSQQRNLEETIKKRIIDRTQLILDIFARHAKSREGKLQVELAQLAYLMPRLVGRGSELSRLGGGIGTLGPGESKLEMDRRRIDERIARLKNDLKEVISGRALTRKKRQGKGVPTVSLVGYTNAGKTTLLNVLAQSDQLTRDGLFTTLDSVSRQMALPNHQKIVLTDTVGFMHDLPHHLIESFKATLEEVQEADLLLHVLDVSNPIFRQLNQAVVEVLRELGVLNKPIITVLNKIDKLEHKNEMMKNLIDNFDNTVCISAKTGENISELLERVSGMLSFMYTEINVDIPISRMDLVNLVHEEGEVHAIKYYNDSINIRALIPTNLVGKFSPKIS